MLCAVNPRAAPFAIVNVSRKFTKAITPIYTAHPQVWQVICNSTVQLEEMNRYVNLHISVWRSIDLSTQQKNHAEDAGFCDISAYMRQCHTSMTG